MNAPAALECDLLVAGSGTGALSAAGTAAALDLTVVVAEKDAQFGGATAWSGGWRWIHGNPLAVESGHSEPPGAVLSRRARTGVYRPRPPIINWRRAICSSLFGEPISRNLCWRKALFPFTGLVAAMAR